ncbi:hypothetical protein [Vibrio alginolyticus]|uniref:hypothetical protein n=1 Tax=Vibrio TaxID=662 RepID=UPI0006CA7104|nr:hypothetical protein [Vibrio alginolyticus]KPM97612.1 hypothetical protein AOG25_14185 [Vibrio alginolyticus]CAH7371224.1 conserved hypothetical protein [Vibrio chagasii]
MKTLIQNTIKDPLFYFSLLIVYSIFDPSQIPLFIAKKLTFLGLDLSLEWLQTNAKDANVVKFIFMLLLQMIVY